jgi:hypothetical protein
VRVRWAGKLITQMDPVFFPTGGFYRRALYAAAALYNVRELLQLGLALARECEYLRTWARQNGLNPPRFEATAEQAAHLGENLLPVEEAINRSRIGAGGAELAPVAPECPSATRRGA